MVHKLLFAYVLVLPSLGLAEGGKTGRTISRKRANVIALRRVPGRVAAPSEMEREDGRLVWEVDVRSRRDGRVYEVDIDARTGRIVNVALED